MFTRPPSEEESAIFEENIDEGRMRFQETIFTLGDGWGHQVNET